MACEAYATGVHLLPVFGWQCACGRVLPDRVRVVAWRWANVEITPRKAPMVGVDVAMRRAGDQ
jgi:hypothetical protein